MVAELQAGANAPSFDLQTDGGSRVALEELRGKHVILYFYPKDDTPGCTKEAIGFTERLDDFTAAGAVVIGVSKDSVASHDKFKTKHDLAITLASDADSDVVERYGCWVEKNMYGRKYMGIERATFLIDKDGVIQQVWRKVRVPGHVDKVLDTLRGLDA